MSAVRLGNGHLLVPRRAEGPNGLIGDGLVEIGPDDPEYEAWIQYLAESGESDASQSDHSQVDVHS